MSTRQYIGARYVPKFFDWGGSAEWRSGVAYEALTIVTRNGNSYTSKIPVPSNIGAPEENPDYWVSTGLYNEQVESIRQLATDTAGTLSGFMSDGAIGTDNLANGAVTTVKIDASAVGTSQLANSAVTTDKLNDASVTTDKVANGAVTSGKIATNAVTTDKINDGAVTVDKIAPKYIINVGDSYQAGYDPAGNNQGWGYYLLSMFGYQGHNIQGVGGAGFGVSEGSQYDLATILESNPPTNIDYDKVTDIVVGAGYNDFLRTGTAIEDGINRFYTHCRTRYPNAKIWLAPIGWAWTNNADGITPNMVGSTLLLYSQVCRRLKINFINSCVGILFGCNGLSTDYKHPTESGNKNIASAIDAALNGLSFLATGGNYNLVTTSTGWTGNVAITVSTIDGIALIRFAHTLKYNGTEITLNDAVINFAHHPLMFRMAIISNTVVKYGTTYANAPISFTTRANGECLLAMQVINSDGSNYVRATSVEPVGSAYYQPSFSLDLMNGA